MAVAVSASSSHTTVHSRDPVDGDGGGVGGQGRCEGVAMVVRRRRAMEIGWMRPYQFE